MKIQKNKYKNNTTATTIRPLTTQRKNRPKPKSKRRMEVCTIALLDSREKAMVK